MSFMRILQQWVVPVAKATRSTIVVGERGGRLAGGERDSACRELVAVDVVTRPMAGDEADALVGMLKGLGHVFPFDDHLWSLPGLPPLAGFVATISAVQSKHGGTSASITLAQWPVDFVIAPAVWTVILWRWSGAAWVHYVVRSDGAKWVDGVRNDGAATAWLTFDTALGVISLTGSPTFYDDAFFFPAHVTAALVAALYAYMGADALPHPRKLTYDGTIFEGGEVLTMNAFDVEFASVPHVPRGASAWDVAAGVVSFRLLEVPS